MSVLAGVGCWALVNGCAVFALQGTFCYGENYPGIVGLHREGDRNMTVWWTESQLEEHYDDMLHEVYGTVDIAGMTYDTSRALKNVDPIAYRVGMAEFADSVMSSSLSARDDEDVKIEGYVS